MMTFGRCSCASLLDLVHVDAVVVAAHAVRHRLEPAAGHVDRRAVGQVAAGGEIEAHEGVARRHQRHERRDIGGGTRMRLDVCEFTSEKLRNPFNCQIFRDVDVLAAAVIAPPRQTLGILVGEDRTLRFQDRFADDVFRRDQLDLVALAGEFAPHRFSHFGVGFRQGCGEQVRHGGAGSRRIGHCIHAACQGWPPTRRFIRADSIPGRDRQAMGAAGHCCPHLVRWI